jgi:hypothetical protein
VVTLIVVPSIYVMLYRFVKNKMEIEPELEAPMVK